MFKHLRFNSPLIPILLLALVLRLFHLQNSVLDWHAFRQADTASVTREFVKNGIDLLRPKYHDLSNIASGLDNLEGWRMVEFPLVNGLEAAVLIIIPMDLVTLSRLVSVAFSLMGIVSLYLLVKSISGQRTAVWAAFLMAVLPYSIFYSRVVLPEPAMLATSLFSLWLFDRWLKTQDLSNYLLSLISLAISLLLKPYVVFTAPVYLALGILRRGKLIFLDPLIYLFAILGTAPLLAWRSWITHFPSGIPASDWLFNGNQIRFRPAWFRWIFWERIGKLFLGVVGLVLAASSLLKPIEKAEWFIYGSWVFGLLGYLGVIATGNVQHDYYQVLLIPAISIFVAIGSIRLLDLLTLRMSRYWSKIVVGTLLGSSLIGGWSQIVGYYNVNHPEYMVAGQVVDQLTPPDAKVIAPAFGDTQFLFQTNRTGWPIGFEIDKKIKLGATHYINTAEDDETKSLETKYTIVRKTQDYTLIDLTKPKTI